ncbi:MAG: YicC family protein [Sphingomonadales bacterium]
MTIRSMTGFARAEGAAAAAAWAVELKSVNGRGLELRCRLPSAFDGFEAPIRAVVARHVTRGNVQLSLTPAAGAQNAHVSVNEALLAHYAALAAGLAAKHDLAPASPAELLALPGVASQATPALDEAARAALQQAVLASVEDACIQLDASRAAEGAQLAEALAALLDQIDVLVRAAGDAAASQPAAVRQRLQERLDALGAGKLVDEQRLAQEVALLATKADVREELDRLRAHLASARDLVARAEPVGRPLDFLSQEFMREANTLCSKAVDPDLTRIGLDLKSAIEQVREQIKNIE